ncbi:MAG: type II toxin-antitoxin system HicB family antitoxin [Thermodesulfobacteriota bacterium]
MRFVLALHSDDGKRFSVTVPDLPDCYSAGESMDEAIENAREAIDLHCEGLVAEGQDIPSPSPISHHQHDPLLADAVWAVVEVEVEKYLSKPVRLNISLPEGLVRRIDQYASAHHLTRSGFLAKAAETVITHQPGASTGGNN